MTSHAIHLDYRRLDPASPSDAAELEKVVMAAPAYSFLVEGKAPQPEDAKQMLQALPPGKKHEDKFIYGIYSGVNIIGCMDLIKNFPNQGTLFIGLLLFSERFHSKGYGSQALKHIEQLSQKWNCDLLRIAVVSTNVRALHYWHKKGFQEIYRKSTSDFTGDAIVMERKQQLMTTED